MLTRTARLLTRMARMSRTLTRMTRWLAYYTHSFSSRAWLSFLAASLAPAARIGAIISDISMSRPQLSRYRCTFGLRPL